MDNLDLLKKHWQQQGGQFRQFDESELFRMSHRRSTSIVKWIFIISVLELFFWIGMSLVLRRFDSIETLKTYDPYHIMAVSEVISYAILLYFIYRFYQNYRLINSRQPVKTLIENILNTRKTVQLYVKIVVAYTIISTLLTLFLQFRFDERMLEISSEMADKGALPAFYAITILLSLLLVGTVVFLIWLFYRLIYGILLDRLYSNYEELQRIDY